MITLKTAELKAAQKRFQAIRRKNIIPILAYLKIEAEMDGAQITKDTLGVFLIHKFTAQGKGSILIDEDTFWNFVNFAIGETIIIATNGNDYTLSSEKSKIKNQLQPPTEYPIQVACPSEPGTPINIGELQNLSAVIIEEEIPTPKSFVFAGEGKACASDGFIGYSVDFKGEQKVAIRKEVAAVLPKTEFEYKTAGNYDFFVSDTMTYAFTKPEIGFYDMKRFFVLPEKRAEMLIEKSDLIRFNELVLSSAKDKTSMVSWELDNGKMTLKSLDAVSNNAIESVIDYNGTGEPFNYVAEQMNRLLKSIPYDTILFIPGENKYYLQAADGGLGLIMTAKN